jgi:hypothetical protein
MSLNSLALASDLSDQELLARITSLAGREREATVELVAHLAVLDTRPVLYAAHSYGSLFGYCTKVLRLSEDAACNRIEAARACRRAVLARACGRSRRQIEALVAELAPRPDVSTSVRKLPTPTPKPLPLTTPCSPATFPITPPAPVAPSGRPIIDHTSPERYRVQFTIGKESHDKLRRLQALLRREIPDGDPGAIVDRALTLLLEKVEKAKLGAAAKPRTPRPIRPGTDRDDERRVPASRHTPSHVKRAAWRRDGGQCGFVAHDGQRCTERTFLEFHHVRPYALGGPATVENISLRCRRHNQYEAELVFGPHRASVKGPSPGAEAP